MHLTVIPLARYNINKKRNNHGYRMINTCKNNERIILNGRCDMESSKFIFCDLSVLDYKVRTIEAYKYLDYFRILPTDCILSDGHSVLDFALKIVLEKAETSKLVKSKRLWCVQKSREFNNNINTQTTHAL